ncbi:MAG: ACP S-malonyltransferase [bacterium]
MSDNHVAFVFPAFASDYTDHPGQFMPGFSDQFNAMLSQAVKFDPVLAGFSFAGNTFLDDELRTQYVTYTYSCAVSGLFRKHHVVPVITAGYSMGIYAALFDSGAISFATGLELIRQAYRSLFQSLKERKFGMGTLIGLDNKDIQQLIDQASLRVEITNQNASHSFVVSGYRDDLQKLMELAKEEGALHTRDLGVSIPYHSSYLEEGAMDFARQIVHLEIGTPLTPVISLIDQIFLSTPGLIMQEVSRNLFHPLNWLSTMQVMREKQVARYAECGPSTGLTKNARFVDGVRFSPLPSMLP